MFPYTTIVVRDKIMKRSEVALANNPLRKTTHAGDFMISVYDINSMIWDDAR